MKSAYQPQIHSSFIHQEELHRPLELWNTQGYQRSKLTTTVWEDESTICYQVDAKSVCVARRQDNDMINGTKLLNVVGMSRGKRDGILKNEKGRVVVKVGAMHLKGVWITFSRAKGLAAKFNILDMLYPLFVEDPSTFLFLPVNQSPKVHFKPSLPQLPIRSQPYPALAESRPYSISYFNRPPLSLGFQYPPDYCRRKPEKLDARKRTLDHDLSQCAKRINLTNFA